MLYALHIAAGANAAETKRPGLVSCEEAPVAMRNKAYSPMNGAAPARRVVPNGPVGQKLQRFKCMSKAQCISHITPSPQKGPKKTYEIFLIAFELSIVFCPPCVVFFGTFLGAGRDMRTAKLSDSQTSTPPPSSNSPSATSAT
jgi:hypothetical protein